MRPTRYEIVVEGQLSRRFALAFDDMQVHVDSGRTTISGVVVDQSQLHGLIDRVGDLGLDLLDLRVAEPDSDVRLRHGSHSCAQPAFSHRASGDRR